MLNNLTYLYQGFRTNSNSSREDDSGSAAHQNQQTIYQAQNNSGSNNYPHNNLTNVSQQKYVQHQRESSLDAARQMYDKNAKLYAKASSNRVGSATGATSSLASQPSESNIYASQAQKPAYYTKNSNQAHDGEENMGTGDTPNDENCQWRANNSNLNTQQAQQIKQQLASQRAESTKVASSAGYNTYNGNPYGNTTSISTQQQPSQPKTTGQPVLNESRYQTQAPQSSSYHLQQQIHSNHQLQQNQQPGYMMKAPTDSPPSCSLTASPARTTEKKMLNIGGSSNNLAPSGANDKSKIAAVQISANSTSSQPPNSYQEMTSNSKAPLSSRSKKLNLNFPCDSCDQSLEGNFLEYAGESETGNCRLCGAFYYCKPAILAQQNNKQRPRQAQLKALVSHAIRDEYQSYHAEVPMNIILLRLEQDSEAYTPDYNPSAFYLQNRELFVEWMFDLSERLRVQPETYHHSVNVFDAYLMREGISSHLNSLPHFANQKRHNVVTLIAMASLFISAKYLEKTYPGINQLLNFVGVPFSYEDFIAHEKDMLYELGWQLQFISTYNVLSHFLCQGVLFSSDRVVHAQSASEALPNLYTAQVLVHNCEIFTSMCLKKHEFLKYDQLTLVCAIIMAARKVCLLQELWPEELTSMSGGIKQPQIKQCMRHIVSFYSEISCSATNTQQSSPAQLSTVQKTAKRTNTQQAQASVSTKKKSRGAEKSQEQTTSKKQYSVGRVAKEIVASYAVQGKNGPVVTPAKTTTLGNNLHNVANSSCNKGFTKHASKRNQQMSGINRSQSKGTTTTTTTTNQIQGSGFEDERCVKSSESAVIFKEGPSGKNKVPNTLTKQDSSKYLKPNCPDKQLLKRTQRASSHANPGGADFKSKHAQNLTNKISDKQVNIQNQVVNNTNQTNQTSGAYQFQVASTTQRTSNNTSTTSGAMNTLNSYMYSQQQPSSLTKQISSKLSNQQNQNDSQTKSTAGQSLKKVIPHPLLRVSDQNSAGLPPCLSTQHSTTNKQGVPQSSANSAQTNATIGLNKVKTQTNIEAMKEIQFQAQQMSTNATSQQIRSINANQSHGHYSSTTAGASTTGQTKPANSNKTEANVSGVNAGNFNMIQQRSLLKQFESMDLVNHLSTQNRDGSTGKYGGGTCSSSGFIVNSLTTATQRANSKSSSCSQNYVQKLVGQNNKQTTAATPNQSQTNSQGGAAHHQQTNAMLQKAVYKSNNYLQSVRDSSAANASELVQNENSNPNTSSTAQQAAISLKMGARNSSSHSGNPVAAVHNQTSSNSNPNSGSNISYQIQQQVQAQDQQLRNRVQENHHHGSQTHINKVVSSQQQHQQQQAAVDRNFLAGYKMQTQRENSVGSTNSQGHNKQFDYSSIQALMANLKPKTASNDATNNGIREKNAAGTGFARSTSRGKEQQMAQANKLSAMLGRSGFGSSNAGGLGSSSLTNRAAGINNSNSAVNVAMSMFHPRPQNLRVKVKGATDRMGMLNQASNNQNSANNNNMVLSSNAGGMGVPTQQQNGVTPNAQIVQAIQRANCYDIKPHRER